MSTEILTLTPELIAAIEKAGFVRNTVEPKTKQGGRYKPLPDATYWHYYSDGEVDYMRGIDCTDDNNHHAMGNCSRTKEEATAARDKQLALVRVQDKLFELTDEPLDWSNFSQLKNILYYCQEDKFFDSYAVTSTQSVTGLYGSKPACDWVIKNMEPDLKLIAGIK